MTVRELIEMLEGEDPDMRVVVSGDNGGGYVDDIQNTEIEEMRKFYGGSEEVLILSGQQVGMV